MILGRRPVRRKRQKPQDRMNLAPYKGTLSLRQCLSDEPFLCREKLRWFWDTKEPHEVLDCHFEFGIARAPSETPTRRNKRLQIITMTTLRISFQKSKCLCVHKLFLCRHVTWGMQCDIGEKASKEEETKATGPDEPRALQRNSEP